MVLDDPALRGRWFDKLARTVSVDFDGVLHPYTDGWVGSVPADEPPTEGARTFLEGLVAKGFRVVVSSSRCDHQEGLDGVWAWLRKWGLARFVEEVTCQKIPAVAYVGRWMVPFRGQWEEIVGGPKSEAEAALKAQRRGPTPSLSESEWGYVGGLIDGEGCISGGRNTSGNPYLRLMVTNQHRPPLEWLAEKLGGSIYEKKPSEQNRYRFPVCQWSLAGAAMGPVLEGCLERQVIRMKDPQARIALSFLEDCRYDGRPSGSLTRVIQEQRLLAISQLNRWGLSLIEPPLVDDRAVPFVGDWFSVEYAIDSLARGRPHGAAPK